MSPNKHRWAWWSLFSFAFLLYASTLQRFYIGYLGDDARDILAAKSLLHGAYNNLQSPHGPPLNFPLPGFPMVLAPFVALVGSHWIWLKALPIFFTLACLYGVYGVCKPFLSERARIALFLVCALNPTTLGLSSQVVADSAYLLACLAAFWFVSQNDNPKRSIALGITALLAALIRPEGILLVASLAGGLIVTRQWRYLLSVMMAGVLWLALLIVNHMRTGSVSGYVTFLNETLPFLSLGPGLLYENGLHVLKTLFFDVLFGLAYEPNTFWQWLAVNSIILMALLVIVRGFWRWRNSPRTPQALALALGIYGLLHIGIHIVWLALDPHYFWPLLPWAAFFLIFSIDRMKSVRLKTITVISLSLVTAILYGKQIAYAMEQTIHVPAENRFPGQTFEWITSHTAADSYFLTPRAACLTLYTNRYSTAYVSSVDQDNLRFQLLELGVTHVLTSPYSFLHVRTTNARDPQNVWAHINVYIQQDTAAYEPLYQNEFESTHLYKINLAPQFQEAYKRYRDTMLAFANAPSIGAGASATLDQLEAVLRIDPFPSALNAFGATALLSNKRMELAQRHLEEAVRQRPTYSLAWTNLARIYARKGDVTKARKAYQKAYEITLTTPSSPDNKHP